ncbi:MAG: hypothetical protein V7L23_29810 [Nostoc sp.]|uniref:hypothetical protein n=1 Tax=Nostoc sp. TaxID=1180 RepID=UPI002FF2BDD5
MDKDWKGCSFCKHLSTKGKCSAFPNGIPIVFASGDVPHFKVVPGQKDEYVYQETASFDANQQS